MTIFDEFGSGTSAPHVQVIGTTGAGKGVSLGVMASQFLELGEAVFFCDPYEAWAPSVLKELTQSSYSSTTFFNHQKENYHANLR